MNHLHFDSIGGASGDMILAALIDLGAPRVALQRRLAGLKIGRFEIRTTPAGDHGLHGLRVEVHNRHDKHPPHRRLPDILALINRSRLPPRVKEQSRRVFRRLAEAEARVHRTTPGRIHFHEVGAVDAIVDIVGSCLALELLSVDAVSVSPLPLGYGTVKSAHGILPVPAPATVELLKGMQVVPADEPFELVTPTGAALLGAWATPGSVPPADGRLVRAGHGFGRHPLTSRPNVLRALLMESAPKSSADTCLVLECNLDDTVPELLGNLLSGLLEAGALDVFLTPVQMKKQRPGTLVTVLCRPGDRERLLDLIFGESTTFGVREYPVRRTILPRRMEAVATPHGKVRVKLGEWKGRIVTRAPEHEDCVRLAHRAGVPVRAVYEAALAAALAGGPSGRKRKTRHRC